MRLNLSPLTVNMMYYGLILISLYTVIFHFDPVLLIATAIAYFCFGCLGVEINAHRYFAHRTFEYRYSWMKYVFSWFTTLAGTGSPMQWVAIHYDHHDHSDAEGDPHNPHEKGLSMFYWLVYPKGNPLNVRYMIKDKYQVWLHRNYMFVHLITWSVLFLLGGWQLVVYGAMMPTALVTLAQVGTTYLCHIGIGYRRYDDVPDRSHNIWWWAIIDFGEGLHNTHHKDPSRWNLRDKWWEIDISGSVIGILRKSDAR